MSNDFLIIIIYDISNNKKRYRLSKLLEGFGERVQKSAFECRLTNQKYDKLVCEIGNIVDDSDYVRVYKLTANSMIKVWGSVPIYEEENFFFI